MSRSRCCLMACQSLSLLTRLANEKSRVSITICEKECQILWQWDDGFYTINLDSNPDPEDLLRTIFKASLAMNQANGNQSGCATILSNQNRE